MASADATNYCARGAGAGMATQTQPHGRETEVQLMVRAPISLHAVKRVRLERVLNPDAGGRIVCGGRNPPRVSLMAVVCTTHGQ